MTDIIKLKDSILDAIKDDNYDFATLKAVLSPLDRFLDNTSFVSALGELINTLCLDRDGDNSFSFSDLKLLKDDISSIISLVNSVLLLMSTIPDTKLKYDSGATEIIIFKVLAYIFLVVVPKQTGQVLTFNDKDDILKIVMSVYKIILSTKMTQDLIEKINNWFKTSKCFGCCSSQVENKQDVIESMVPVVNKELARNLQKVRELN